MKRYEIENKNNGLKKMTTLYDKAIASTGSSLFEGYIVGITEEGIHLRNQNGEEFFKWENIVKLAKQ